MTEASRASKLDSFQEGHVAANANLLILGGHETTASALAYASYLLALHPEVQERLAEEIDNYLQEHPVRYCFIWLYMSCTLITYMITNCTVLHNIHLSFCMQTQCSIMWERVVLQYQLYNRVGTLPTFQMLSECCKSPEEYYSIWPTRATPPYHPPGILVPLLRALVPRTHVCTLFIKLMLPWNIFCFIPHMSQLSI